MPTRLIAATFALTAFATAVVVGLLADNAAVTILWRALLAMIACYLVGLLIGDIARRSLEEQIEIYKRNHPIEPADATTAEAAAGVETHADAQPASPNSSSSDTPTFKRSSSSQPQADHETDSASTSSERTASSDSGAAA